MTEYNKRILKIVTDDIIDENDELFLKEIEAASANPRFANTKESDEKMKKALDEAFAVKKPRSKALLRAASVFLALLVGLSVMTLTVKGFREKLWEVLSNIGNPSYSFMLASESKNENKLSEYEGQYIPTWIPEGYEVVEVFNDVSCSTISFKNKQGKTISYSEHKQDIEKKFNLDKEDYDSYEVHTLVNKEVIITTKETVVFLIVKEKDAIIHVNFDDSNIDALSFSEMIEKK
ncbi:MAG: DUF4367 domain-containing protein [Clostridia bacterium]|nr:DUF4367 domain-containing protein [Clostridia bacterium]